MSRSLAALLCGLALLAAAPAPASAAGAPPATPSGQVLRLHIVANSNRPADIAAKVAVRTAILAYLGGRLAGAQSAAAAADRLLLLTRPMTRLADETLRGYGLRYGAKIAVGTAVLPRRRYLGQDLPGGRYLTLDIVLGQGRGQNWWCMLFPELCLSDGGAAVSGVEGAARSPSDFIALGSPRALSTGLEVRPGGLLWRFWELVRGEGHRLFAPR